VFKSAGMFYHCVSRSASSRTYLIWRASVARWVMAYPSNHPGSLLVQPRGIPAHDVIDPKVIGGRQMTFHVGVVRVVHLLPGHREHGRVLFHDVFCLTNERFAPGSV